MKKLFLLPILLLLFTGCRTTLNVSPPPTSVPPSLTAEEVERAILFTLKDAPAEYVGSPGYQIADRLLGLAFGESYSRRQYWFFEGRGDHAVYIGYHNRNHYMRVEAKYDDKNITYKIVDSRNLRQSGDRIHENAFVFLSYLERNVRTSLGAYDRYKYEQEQKQTVN